MKILPAVISSVVHLENPRSGVEKTILFPFSEGVKSVVFSKVSGNGEDLIKKFQNYLNENFVLYVVISRLFFRILFHHYHHV